MRATDLARDIARALGPGSPECGLLEYVVRLTPRFSPPYHLRPVADLLEAATRGQEVRAVVSTPPRHGKTELLLHGIVWRLSRDPGATIGYVAYSVEFARSKSRRARMLAQAAGVRIVEDAARLEEWRTPAGGGLLATGVGGPLTGHGLDLLIVDDPVKNRLEAESATYRERLWEWFTDVAMTRLEPGASAVVVMTRWHEDDLAGRLVRDGWQYVRLPALDDHGRALWPERWPAERLEAVRRAVGEYTWSSLYQGRPRPRGGALFDGVYTYSELPQGLRWAVGVDWAYSSKTHADYSVAVVLSTDGERYYVVDVVRRQVPVTRWLEALRSLRAAYPAAVWHTIVGGTEQGIVDLAVRDGIPIRATPARGDKFTRWQPLAAAWNAGRVLVPVRATWLDSYLAELLGATGVGDDHDDQVDATVAAYEALRRSTDYETVAVRSGRV